MSKDRKDLRLVRPEEPIDTALLDAATDALRSAVSPGELDAVDHEALIAMTLGEDVSQLGDPERAAAEQLRRALDGRGSDPLAELAGALKAAHAADDMLATADHEAILALALGAEGAFGEDEVARAAELAVALEHGSAHALRPLADALKATHDVRELFATDAELILAMVVGDEDIAVAAEERAEAERLRAAIDGEASHPLLGLTQALRACGGKLRNIDELGHERILRRVLIGADPRHGDGRKSGRVTVLTAIMALAAAIALFAGSWRWLETGGGATASRPPAAQLDLVMSRSTSELFDPMQPFPAKGGESERMGRIVRARQADLRANRFASWGVR